MGMIQTFRSLKPGPLFRGFRQRYLAVMMSLLAALGVLILVSNIHIFKQERLELAADNLENDVRTLKALHEYHVKELLTRARLLASEPKIIAALGTPDIDARTIQQLTDSIREAGRLDVLLIRAVDGTHYALAMDGYPTMDSKLDRAELPGEEGGFLKLGSRDVLAVTVPVSIQELNYGYLMIGEYVRGEYLESYKDVVTSDIVFSVTDNHVPRVMISSFSRPVEPETLRHLTWAANHGSHNRALQTFLPSQPSECLIRSAVINDRVEVHLVRSLARAEATIAQITHTTILIALLLLVVSYFVIRHLTRAAYVPIKRLVDSTDRFAAGDFNQRVPAGGPDEFQRLSSSFNQMADRLQTLIRFEQNAKQVLEQRVEERTADLARTNEMLIEANERIREQSNRMIQFEKLAGIGTLAAGVAHELNNPLAVISGSAELLEKSAPDPALKSLLDTIIKHSRRAGDIVKRMLRFARQQGPEQRTECNLNSLVDIALELLKLDAQYAPITVVRRYDASLPATKVDEGAIEQAVINVVSNAFQAMMEHRGGGTLTVETGLTQDRDVFIRIGDTGPGIPREHQDRIFDPFFTTKAVGKGTGLGLSVSHGIVEQHRGKIYLENSDERGSTFVIELPVVCEEAALDELADLPAACSNSPNARALLVVDDEPDIRNVIRLFMEFRGFEVFEASSADDALGVLKARAGRIDVMFVDIRMPDRNGMEFYKEVAEHYGPAAASRIVFITGDTLSYDIQAFLAKHNCQSIIKPFQSKDLYACADQVTATAV